jgi:hypothetical protein
MMKLLLIIISITYSLTSYSQDWGLLNGLRGTDNWEQRRKNAQMNLYYIEEMNRIEKMKRDEQIQNTYNENDKISCNDAIIYVLDEGVLKAEVDEYSLNSSWLKKAKIYEIDDKYVVLAWIKPKDYYSDVYLYVFCEIPASNWNYFVDKNNISTLSYGERFNKYIFENKCNCQ